MEVYLCDNLGWVLTSDILPDNAKLSAYSEVCDALECALRRAGHIVRRVSTVVEWARYSFTHSGAIVGTLETTTRDSFAGILHIVDDVAKLFYPSV